jgi:hypothetical protein
MITVALDGLEFATDGNPTYTISRLDGWYGAPSTKTRLDERPRSDGAFQVIDFQRSARAITMSGQVHASGSGRPEWLALSALLGAGLPRTLAVTDELGTQTTTVILAGLGVTIEPITDQTALYVVSMLAPDPIKYGASRQLVTGLPTAGGGLTYNLFDPAGTLDYGANGNLGRVELTNAGTAEVWPTVRVDGGLAGGFFAQRLDTGQTVRYDRVIPVGSWVEVDFASGAVVVDGDSDGSTYLTRGEFFSVPPGGAFDVQFNGIGAATGTPLMTVTIADGYW